MSQDEIQAGKLAFALEALDGVVAERDRLRQRLQSVGDRIEALEREVLEQAKALEPSEVRTQGRVTLKLKNASTSTKVDAEVLARTLPSEVAAQVLALETKVTVSDRKLLGTLYRDGALPAEVVEQGGYVQEKRAPTWVVTYAKPELGGGA